MKNALLVLVSLLVLSGLEAQTPYKAKKRKKDYFGKVESPNDGKVRPIGIQVQLGLTHTFTRSKNETYTSTDTAGRYTFVQDPSGRPGFFAEIGLVHFNVKDPVFKFGRIIDYIDYGIGFKLLTGRESTTINYQDVTGAVIGSATGRGEFSNGYLYARFGVHKLQYINKTKNYFIDHSLGLNADYMLTGGEKNYQAPYIAANQYFAKPFVMQLHYDIGFGIRIKKGTYLIPGVQLPFLGIQEWNKGNPSLRWYSSKYYPALFHVKFIKLFPAKKGKGCYEGDPADKKLNEQYLQSQ